MFELTKHSELSDNSMGGREALGQEEPALPAATAQKNTG